MVYFKIFDMQTSLRMYLSISHKFFVYNYTALLATLISVQNDFTNYAKCLHTHITRYEHDLHSSVAAGWRASESPIRPGKIELQERRLQLLALVSRNTAWTWPIYSESCSKSARHVRPLPCKWTLNFDHALKEAWFFTAPRQRLAPLCARARAVHAVAWCNHS